MTLTTLVPTLFTALFDNALNAYDPEVWAQESLMVLENNMVMGNLVHRDFENEIKEFGDIVNTRRPNTFEMKRKGDNDDVENQDAIATNVQVPLNQHGHVSFLIRDAQMSRSFKDLATEFLNPALLAIAEGIDSTLLGQTYAFLGNSVGQLGTPITKSTFTALRALMNTNKVPMIGRSLVVGPNMEADALNIDDFVNANTVGDEGTAMREAHLGKKYGFQTFMDQNAAEVDAGTPANTVQTKAINLAAGYPKGTTVMVVDGAGTIVAGAWCLIGGVPYFATAGGATSLTIAGGLRDAVADDAPITSIAPGAVNLVAGYSANYVKEIAVDAIATAVQTQQLYTLGTTVGTRYSALGTQTTTAMLGHLPLSAAVVNDAVVGIGPAGNYGFAFVKNALALVSRPLATISGEFGAKMAVIDYRGLTLRVTLAYDSKAQGLRVTVDLLYGTAVLDERLGAVVLG